MVFCVCFVGVAQLVEHRTHKPGVVGSIPTSDTCDGSTQTALRTSEIESRSYIFCDAKTSEAGSRHCEARVVTNPHLRHNHKARVFSRFVIIYSLCAGSNNAVVAQLVRAPACHAGGCGFKSRSLRIKKIAGLCWAIFLYPGKQAMVFACVGT